MYLEPELEVISMELQGALLDASVGGLSDDDSIGGSGSKTSGDEFDPSDF